MNGSEGVCVFYEVLGEVGRFVSSTECMLVFLEPCDRAPAGLSHIRFTTIGACQLVYSGRECRSEVCCICINNFYIVLVVRNAICMLVFLNRLLLNVVSLPT